MVHMLREWWVTMVAMETIHIVFSSLSAAFCFSWVLSDNAAMSHCLFHKNPRRVCLKWQQMNKRADRDGYSSPFLSPWQHTIEFHFS